jgi:hypothetical protein
MRMRQHLDTIPVWDAFKENSECPLCSIREKNEAAYVDNFLGGSVMEPATRIEVNRKGFCERHLRHLFNAGNRLGLALMAHTHLKDSMERIEKNAEKLAAAAATEGAKSFPQRAVGRLTRKPAETRTPSEEALAISESCILCDRLNNTMERYALTILYMYKHEAPFKAAFGACKGFCLPHYAQLAHLAPKELSGKDLQGFLEVLIRIERENLSRIEQEIDWFTQKFDYKNRDKPWGDSADALERTVGKLRGKMTK